MGFMGTMHEAGTPLLMSVRLRIQLGRITEIESMYFRQGGGGPANIAALDAARIQARRHVVQIDSAGPASVAPGDDFDRRRVFQRPGEERRQGRERHRNISFHK